MPRRPFFRPQRHRGARRQPARPRYLRGAAPRETNRLRLTISEWRLALRIARRAVWRSRGTSLIVVLMVLLPVAGFSAAAVIIHSSLPTPSEKIAAELGSTEAKVLAWYPPDPELTQDPFDPGHVVHMSDDNPPDGRSPDDAAVRALFPPNTRIVKIDNSSVRAVTEHGVGEFPVTVGPLWDPMFAGRTHIVDGEAPVSDTDALVTPAALTRLGVRVGDSIRITHPVETNLTVTGVLSDAQNTADAEGIYLRHGEFAESIHADGATYFLPNTPISSTDLPRLNHAGVTVLSKQILSEATQADLADSAGLWRTYGVVLTMAALFATFEIVLLAGAAFAVGARKQQRALAVLASVGGQKRMLTRVVLAQGIVLGGLGGLAGTALGIPLAAGYMSWTDDGSATQYWGFHVSPLALGGILLLAVLVGLISAVVPARAAARFDVLAALRGSRRPATPSRTAPRWGLLLLLLGTGATLLGAVTIPLFSWTETGALKGTALGALLLGPLLAQVGALFCGGVILRFVARVLSRLGLGARLASRDSAANTARSVPAFASVMVTAFLAVTAITVGSAMAAANDVRYTYQALPGQVRVYLPSDDGATPNEIADVVRADLDTSAVATFYRPLTTWDDSTGEPLSGEVVVPDVPTENRCPLDPLSPEYSDQASATQIDRQSRDWRCDPHAQDATLNPQPITVTDAGGLRAAYGDRLPQSVLTAFENGAPVATSRAYVHNDRVTLQWWEPDASWSDPDEAQSPLAEKTLEVVVATPPKPLNTRLFVSTETAQKLGIELQPDVLLATTDSEFTTAQIDALNGDLEAFGTSAMRETGPPQTMLYVIIATLLIAGVLFLCASGVAIGLSRADGRADDATLAAVGATRMLRRSFAFWQAIGLVAVGTLIGSAAGILISYGLTLAGATGAPEFSPPWLTLAALTVGMPVLIACGSWLVASRPAALTRRAAIG